MADVHESRAQIANIDVRGEVVLAILESMHSLGAEALKILGRNGITGPGNGTWHPLSGLLSSFREIEGAKTDTTLFTIGHKIHRNAVVPTDIDDFLEALARIDEAYHMNHRGGDIGHYRFERLDGNRARIISTSLYPCEFDRGVVHGFSALARPAGLDRVFVNHSEDLPCRRRDGESCTYDISW